MSRPPRIALRPEFGGAPLADEAAELAAAAGLVLDEWQRDILQTSLGVRDDGRWAAFEVGLAISRQNGKDGTLMARELAELYLLPAPRLVIHSAHQADTAFDHFRKLLFLIENADTDLFQGVAKVSNSHGLEGITMRNGSQIQFRTRTKSGGRGFSADLLILNESMDIPEAAHGALLPTLSARPNPQVWYTGSSVDQFVHQDGTVFSRVRRRALDNEKSLAYFEWSLDYENPDEIPEEVIQDPESWAQANPALGIRITPEHVELEKNSMDPRTFAVERLGVGDWPPTDSRQHVINLQRWLSLADGKSQPLDPVCFSVDVTPDRSFASVGVCGPREDGLRHLEVADRRRGTGWLFQRLLELDAAHHPLGFVIDGAGPAASLIHDLEQAGLNVITVSAREHAEACGLFFDAVIEETVRHLGQGELQSAIKGAVKRPLGDAWAWSRKNSAVDISPLVAVTLAHWGVVTQVQSEVFAAAW